MNCGRCRKRMGAYVDRAVLPTVRAEMDEHLATCASCRAEMEAVEKLGDVLRAGSPPGPIPEGFAARVMARADGEEEARRRISWPWVQSWAWRETTAGPVRAAAAAVLVVGLAIGGLMGWDLSRARRGGGSPAGDAKEVAAYSLDYLGDAPDGSLAQVVLAMDK